MRSAASACLPPPDGLAAIATVVGRCPPCPASAASVPGQEGVSYKRSFAGGVVLPKAADSNAEEQVDCSLRCDLLPWCMSARDRHLFSASVFTAACVATAAS